MPRRPRADEAGGLYHVLNRGNARQTIFRKDADYEAFEKILSEGLEFYDVSLFSFQLMPHHWHLVLRSNRDGAISGYLRWVTATHTMRYHAQRTRETAANWQKGRRVHVKCCTAKGKWFRPGADAILRSLWSKLGSELFPERKIQIWRFCQ